MADGFPPFTLVTASSEALFDGLTDAASETDRRGGRFEQSVPVGTPDITSLSFPLSAETEMRAEFEARIFAGKCGDAPGRLLLESRLPWSGGGTARVDWLVRLSPMNGIKVGGFIRVELDLPPGLGWVRHRTASDVFPGGAPGNNDPAARAPATHCFQVEPPQPCFWAANVLPDDGVGNRFTGLWKSDPGKAFPQWLELSWKDAMELREIHLQFPDTEECPTAYALEITSAAGDRREVRVTDNLACRAVHPLDPPVLADAVRISFFATRGGKAVAVREVSCRSAV